VPDLTHLWQRFLLASALVAGLLIGAAATVFGYSNLSTVSVRWSVFHADGVPLWTVAVVPLAILLVAGTIYHWMDGLHHFSEHMRHRHRVHELEAEVASLRSHLDQVLEMPDQSTSGLQPKSVTAKPLKLEPLAPVEEKADPAPPEPLVPAEAVPAPAPTNGVSTAGHPRVRRAKRAALVEAKPARPLAAATNGGHAIATTEPAPEPEP
jgi:hypothetical protein